MRRSLAGMMVALLVLASAAGGQSSVVGRWVENPPVGIWEFDAHGSVVLRIPMPGAAGTFRLDDDRLLLVFGDQSRDSSTAHFIGDTMVTFRPQGGETRATRVGVRPDPERPVLGTWRGASGLLMTYRKDGSFVIESARQVATYVERGGIVAVASTLSGPSAGTTTRYQVTIHGVDTTLVGLPPETRVLRRLPCVGLWRRALPSPDTLFAAGTGECRRARHDLRQGLRAATMRFEGMGATPSPDAGTLSVTFLGNTFKAAFTAATTDGNAHVRVTETIACKGFNGLLFRRHQLMTGTPNRHEAQSR